MSDDALGLMHCDVCGRNFASPQEACDFCGANFMGDDCGTPDDSEITMNRQDQAYAAVGQAMGEFDQLIGKAKRGDYISDDDMATIRAALDEVTRRWLALS